VQRTRSEGRQVHGKPADGERPRRDRMLADPLHGEG
jgi:hypothetical protein